MAYPTYAQSVKLTETAPATTHTLPAFSSLAAGNTMYAVFAIGKKQVASQIALSGWGASQTWSMAYQVQTGVNGAVSLVRVYRRASGSGDRTPLVLTTDASCIVAAVGAKITGAAAASLGSPNLDEMLPNYPNDNPTITGQPMKASASLGRIPFRDDDSGPQVDAKVVVGFGRVGKNVFKTIPDEFGNGLSAGGPYLVRTDRDSQWGQTGPGTPNGSNTTPFAVIDHAESAASSGWKVQAGLCHRDIPAAEWAGHPDFASYVYAGQIMITYWCLDAQNQVNAPSAMCGIRLHV